MHFPSKKALYFMSDLVSRTTKLDEAMCFIRVLCRITRMRGLME
jgi:hypothetical protein